MHDNNELLGRTLENIPDPTRRSFCRLSVLVLCSLSSPGLVLKFLESVAEAGNPEEWDARLAKNPELKKWCDKLEKLPEAQVSKSLSRQVLPRMAVSNDLCQGNAFYLNKDGKLYIFSAQHVLNSLFRKSHYSPADIAGYRYLNGVLTDSFGDTLKEHSIDSPISNSEKLNAAFRLGKRVKSEDLEGKEVEIIGEIRKEGGLSISYVIRGLVLPYDPKINLNPDLKRNCLILKIPPGSKSLEGLSGSAVTHKGNIMSIVTAQISSHDEPLALIAASPEDFYDLVDNLR